MKRIVPKEIYETNFNIIHGDDYICFSSNDQVWVGKILKIKEEFPDAVDIRHTNPDGSIVAHIDKKCLSIRKPVVRNYSDEQKQAARERLMAAREGRYN